MSKRFAKLLSLALLSLLSSCGGGLGSDSDGVRKPLAAAPAAAYSRDDLYRFFVVAFGAAPGVTYMGQAVSAADAGASIRQVVNAFTTKSQFLDTYPASLSDLAFAQKLTDNVVGTSATAVAKNEAIQDIANALKLPGMTRGDIVYIVFNNLANKPATDPTWGKTAVKMANQVEYAKYYTDSLAGDSDKLSVLRQVVSGVTETSRIDAMSIQSMLRADSVVSATLIPLNYLDEIVWVQTENEVDLPPNPFGSMIMRGSFEVIDLFGAGYKSLFVPSGREFNTPRSPDDVDQISFSVVNGRIQIDPKVISPKYVAGFATSSVKGYFGTGRESVIWADQGRELKDSSNHTDGSYLWRMDRVEGTWRVTEFAKNLGRQFWHSTNNALDVNGDGILDFVASTLFGTENATRLGAVLFLSNTSKTEPDQIALQSVLCGGKSDVLTQSGTSSLIRMSKGHAAVISLPYVVTSASAASHATIAELSTDGQKVEKVQCIQIRGIELTKTLSSNEGFNSIKVLDLNGDGLDDFIAMAESISGKGKKLLAFTQAKDGAFKISNIELKIPFEYSLPSESAEGYEININNEIIVGDINGDGKLDITTIMKQVRHDSIERFGLRVGLVSKTGGFELTRIPYSKILWNKEYKTTVYDMIVPVDINNDGILDYALFGVFGDKKYITPTDPYGVFTKVSFLVSTVTKRGRSRATVPSRAQE